MLKQGSEILEIEARFPVSPGYEYRTTVKKMWSGKCLGAWFLEIWDFRDLFYFLVWRDIKVRYKQTVLGALWAVIQPFFTMILLTAFFGKIAGIGTEDTPYPILSYCALVPWAYFSGALSSCANSMVSNSSLFTKIYFPRIAVPVSAVAAGLIDFAIASLLLLALIPYYNVPITLAVIFWPILAMPLFFLVLGLGIIMASLSVRYRDVKYALPFVIQLMMLATPIIYPLAVVPVSYRWLSIFNPLTGIIEAFRAIVLKPNSVDFFSLGVSLVETVAIFGFGLVYFRKTERVIADVI